MKFFGGKLFSGGQATRAELYGVAAVVVILLGGGITGAVASSGAFRDENVAVKSSPSSNSSSADSSATGGTSATQSSQGQNATNPGASGVPIEPSRSGGNANVETKPVSSCPYTSEQLYWFAKQRADLETQISAKKAEIAGYQHPDYSTMAGLQELITMWEGRLANPNDLQRYPEQYNNVVNVVLPPLRARLAEVSSPTYVDPIWKPRFDAAKSALAGFELDLRNVPTC